MREILFRGKRIDNGEWVEGGIVHQTDYYGDSVDRYFIIDGTDTDDIIGPAYRVHPSTVGQFTGLTDKNGKKIFEGDILEVHDESPLFDGYDSEELQFNGKVLFEEDTGMYVCENSEQGNAFCNMNLSKCKVIGNVYDNPELLEVGE